MTSRKDFKKLVRKHAAKTGKSYTASRKDIEARAEAQPPTTTAVTAPAEDGVAALLKQLSSLPFGVIAGRLPAIGTSADAAVASAHARDLAINPKFFAESGAAKMIVTEDQVRTLVAAGAADSATTQLIRSFHNEHGATFSARCRLCDGWLWCGEHEHEATCTCGQPYRVVFDLHRLHHWSMPQGRRCFDCGSALQLTPPQDGRNPWKFLNEWQVRCNACMSQLPRLPGAMRLRGDGT
jgi:hypothetical protein